ncbi:MAG: hypothetical protein KY468_09295 [Armatimonadetes bacterium]|nr:hypothetical protein [Armatimonadota bacterium]
MVKNRFKSAEIVGFKVHPYSEEGIAVGVIFCDYGEALYEVEIFTDDGCAGRVMEESQLIKLTEPEQRTLIQKLPESRRKELLEAIQVID